MFVNITSDVLIRYFFNLIIYISLYAIFKVHKDASVSKTIMCDKLACLSINAFRCIGM